MHLALTEVFVQMARGKGDLRKRECSQSFGPQVVDEWHLADVNELHLRIDRKRQHSDSIRQNI